MNKTKQQNKLCIYSTHAKKNCDHEQQTKKLEKIKHYSEAYLLVAIKYRLFIFISYILKKGLNEQRKTRISLLPTLSHHFEPS